MIFRGFYILHFIFFIGAQYKMENIKCKIPLTVEGDRNDDIQRRRINRRY
jgi:hypothetical protein